MNPDPQQSAHSPSRVLQIAQDLIRIDTTNFGSGRSRGEEEAAHYVEAQLQQFGLKPQLYEAAPKRTNVVATVPGSDSRLAPLIIHGHLDVVPAGEGWSRDPFGGEIESGCLWGRGAVDMKNMLAMTLSSMQRILDSGRLPRRPVILAFLADEEDGGGLGAHHLVDTHPALFASASHAIGEVGGFSIDAAGRRTYLIQAAEKGMLWVRLSTAGEAGHSSRVYDSTSVTRLVAGLTRLSDHAWPVKLTEVTDVLIRSLRSALGLIPATPPEHVLSTLDRSAAGFIRGSLRTTANTTVLHAGTTSNVVPARAEALVDIRPMLGDEDAVLEEVRRIVGPDVHVEVLHHSRGVTAPATDEFFGDMANAILQHDPDAEVLPYLLPAGTDNKAFARLGVSGYGFAPLRLPSAFNFPDMFHNPDERVPTDSLEFGTDVLETFLTAQPRARRPRAGSTA